MDQEPVILKLEAFIPATSFTLICGGRVETIFFHDIIRIEKTGSDSIIFSVSGTYKTHRSRAELLRDLPVNQFFRINRSQVIALHKVNCCHRNRLYIGEGYVTITKYYKQQLLQSLSWILEQQYQTLSHEAGIRLAL